MLCSYSRGPAVTVAGVSSTRVQPHSCCVCLQCVCCSSRSAVGGMLVCLQQQHVVLSCMNQLGSRDTRCAAGTCWFI
jgi:hypothetical protein